MSCSICHIRKEKRFCPAVHDRICPQCCGTEREVTFDCPAECVYLQQARRHERPRPLQDLDPAALFPDVEVSEEFLHQREPLIIGLSFAVAKAARGDRSLRDSDIIASLASVAKSYETLVGSGLLYEPPTASVPQQALSAELQKSIAEYRRAEQQHIGYATLKDGDALRAIVFLLRLAHARTSGRPRSRAFIDFVLEQFPPKESLITASQESSRIIVP
ncbi:MAG: hypothetical protein ACE14M_08620 [Terriglobales bacterium]